MRTSGQTLAELYFLLSCFWKTANKDKVTIYYFIFYLLLYYYYHYRREHCFGLWIVQVSDSTSEAVILGMIQRSIYAVYMKQEKSTFLAILKLRFYQKDRM